MILDFKLWRVRADAPRRLGLSSVQFGLNLPPIEVTFPAVVLYLNLGLSFLYSPDTSNNVNGPHCYMRTDQVLRAGSLKLHTSYDLGAKMFSCDYSVVTLWFEVYRDFD